MLKKLKKFRETIGHFCIRIVSYIWFERFIFLSIILSSIFLALSDYNCVDNDNNLLASCSLRNTILIESEIVFVIIFTLECLLKMVAYGIFYSPYSSNQFFDKNGNKKENPKPYFVDKWNWLDFVVVVFAIVSIVGASSGKLNLLRDFKVLRPLKAIKSLPGVAAIVTVLLISLPQMIDILLAILFSFYIFSIIGLQVFGGPYLHTRCRLTPFPVNISWIPTTVPQYFNLTDSNSTITTLTYLYDYNEYRCINSPNFDTQMQYPNWGKSDSPWSNAHPECYWPIDENDVRNCALPLTSGNWQCLAGPQYGISEHEYRWCGSNYDAVGNPRFSSSSVTNDTYIPSLFYGFVNFDNVGYSFVYVLQVVSGDSWSTIMFQLFNSFSVIGSAVYCCFLIIYGTFFLLQLNVAVLQKIFTDKDDEDFRQKRIQEKRLSHRITQNKMKLSIKSFDYNRLNSSSDDNINNNDDSSQSVDDCNVNSSQDEFATAFPLPSLMSNELPKEDDNVVIKNDILVLNSSLSADDSNNSFLMDNKNLDETSSNDSKNDILEKNIVKDDENNTPSPTVNTIHVIQQLNDSMNIMKKPSSSKSMNKKSKSSKNISLLKLATVAPIETSKEREIDSRESVTLLDYQTDKVSVKAINSSTIKSSDTTDIQTMQRDTSLKSLTTSSEDHSISLIDRASIFINSWDRPHKNYFRRICYDISQSFLFRYFFTGLIIINTIVLSADHYPSSIEFYNVGDVVAFFLTIFFAFEMVIILLGIGLVEYFSDSFNIMDSIIVLVSLIDISISPLPALLDPSVVNNQSGTTIALRSLRLLRILKLFRSATFKRTLSKVISVVYSMRDFLIILIIFLFILALAGMQIFANRLRFDANGFPINNINSDEFAYAPDRPRSNFDNFTIAFLAIFQIVTIDNWSTIMFNLARSSLGPGSMAFAIFCFLMGTFFLTNLFLALLVDRFTSNHDINGDLMTQESSEIVKKEIAIPINSDSSNILGSSTSADNLLQGSGVVVVSPSGGKCTYSYFKKVICTISQSHIFNGIILFFVCLSTLSLAFDNPLLDPSSVYVFAFYIIDCVVTAVFLLEFVIKIIELGIYSDKNSYFRNGWNILDFVVVIVCVLSLVAGSVGDKIKSIRSIRALKALRTLRMINQFTGLKLVFTSIILSLPAISQIGFIVFLIYFIFAIFFTSFLKGQLRSCQNGLFQSNMTNMNLETYPIAYNDMSLEQKGWFGPNGLVTPSLLTSNCSSIWPQQPCCVNLDPDLVPKSRDICECWGGQWLPVTNFRFDNVAMSLVTLFDDGTIDNWSDNMHFVADSRGIDMEPVRDNRFIWYYIFFVFIIIGNFLCIQLFIGAITKSFNDHKVEMINGGSAFLTKEQHEWISATRLISQVTPKKKVIRPKNIIRAVCFDICSHPFFDSSVMICVICQCILLSITYFGESDTYSLSLHTANTILTCIFGVEIIIKLVGLGVRDFFADFWNWLDFFITLTSAAILIRLAITGDSTGLLVNLVRILRLIRVLSLLESIESLRRLVDCMVYIVPALTNICVLLVFTIYIFDVIGVQLFAKIAYYGSYSQDSNFRTFGYGMITLFRMTTADNWGLLMYDSAYNTDGCVVDPPYNASYCGFNNYDGCIPLNGCGTVTSFPFWIIYIIIMNFVLLSVFISVIISTYHQIKKGDIRQETIDKFSHLWKEYDPHATSYIKVGDLRLFVATCCYPLGFDGEKFSSKQYNSRVNLIQIYIIDGEQKVHFRDVITALTNAHYHRRLQWQQDIFFDIAHHFSSYHQISSLEMFISKLMGKITSVVFLREDEVFTVQHLLAAQKIQQVWKDKVKEKLIQQNELIKNEEENEEMDKRLE